MKSAIQWQHQLQYNIEEARIFAGIEQWDNTNGLENLLTNTRFVTILVGAQISVSANAFLSLALPTKLLKVLFSRVI